jgi:putative hydrolase of the HAD superfamily
LIARAESKRAFCELNPKQWKFPLSITGQSFHCACMTFLFDIGNVLLRFDYKKPMLSLVPPHLGDAAARLSLLEEKKDDLESGRIEADVFISWALDTLGSDASPDDFRLAWRSIFTPIHETWELVKKLKTAGHRLILFSNINAIHHPWIFEEFPIFSHFDGAVMSYQIGCMKPSDEFYLRATKLYQLDPGDTIYIDDLKANIEAGRRFGFVCHMYEPGQHRALLDFLQPFELS